MSSSDLQLSELRFWPAFELEESPQGFRIIDRDFNLVVDKYPPNARHAAEEMVAYLNDDPDLARQYEGYGDTWDI